MKQATVYESKEDVPIKKQEGPFLMPWVGPPHILIVPPSLFTPQPRASSSCDGFLLDSNTLFFSPGQGMLCSSLWATQQHPNTGVYWPGGEDGRKGSDRPQTDLCQAKQEVAGSPITQTL